MGFGIGVYMGVALPLQTAIYAVMNEFMVPILANTFGTIIIPKPETYCRNKARKMKTLTP